MSKLKCSNPGCQIWKARTGGMCRHEFTAAGVKSDALKSNLMDRAFTHFDATSWFWVWFQDTPEPIFVEATSIADACLRVDREGLRNWSGPHSRLVCKVERFTDAEEPYAARR